MKKILFAIAFSLIYCLAQAQSVDAIFRKFKNNQGAEYIDIPMSAIKDKNELDAIKKIKSIKVLNLKSYTLTEREYLRDYTKKLSKKNYEILLSVCEDNTDIKILSKKRQDQIKEVFIVCIQPEECTLVHVDGEINMNDINKLVNINK